MQKETQSVKISVLHSVLVNTSENNSQMKRVEIKNQACNTIIKRPMTCSLDTLLEYGTR